MIYKEELCYARIMVIDDNEANVLLLTKILKQDGYTNVRSITDSRLARQLYLDFRPDLILLDIMMPYLDGFQVMEILKSIEPDSYIPVLVITAQQDWEIKLRALKAGAKDFLSKPLNKMEVLSRIYNMLEVRLLHNQIRDQNAILEQKVRERTRELQKNSRELHDTRLEVIYRLGRASEYRDHETGLHIIRMSKMSALLGKAAGMSESESDLLLNASPMHDVGKIGIPDHVLLKPGKLDSQEWKIMKTHTTIGAEILSGHTSGLILTAQTVALSHHEKWNGTGYPHGLEGESIPLEGRICAICDVFDALTSARIYKKEWSIEKAIAEINNESGKHFDPELVDAFMGSITGMIATKKEYEEPV